MVTAVIRDCSTLMSSLSIQDDDMVYVAQKLRKKLNNGGKDLLKRKIIFIPSNVGGNHWILFVLFNPWFRVSLSEARAVP